MKAIRKIFIALIILFIIVVGSVFIFLQTTKPVYDGAIELKELSSEAKVYFDDFGIPHIYAANEEDLFAALGYVHAQDRLFQMELVKRVADGRLSEVLGSKLIDADKFFRMLGVPQHATNSAELFFRNKEAPAYKAAMAYLNGINQYIEKGKTPVEFLLAGIPKKKFELRDMFLIVDFMSFNFQMAFRTDPLMSKIKMVAGDGKFNELNTGYAKGTLRNEINRPDSIHLFKNMYANAGAIFKTIEELIPHPLLIGSNGWVLSPKKSASGRVLFANDTHIGFSSPSVWYEAYIECPGFSLYGNYLAGFPFAPIGHTPHHAWGLTIFENDDLDFFEEQYAANSTTEIIYKNEKVKLAYREEIIHVKDSVDVVLKCYSSPHGPVCNNVIHDFDDITKNPISISWTLLQFPNHLFDVAYGFSHARSLDEMQQCAANITAPGLNILYGDSSGNIAWWAAARLVKRNADAKPFLLLNGSSGEDDWLGYYDFKDNPMSVNPSSGFVYSANQQPDSCAGVLHSGYYVPDDRALVIHDDLSKKEKYAVGDMQMLQGNVASKRAADNLQILLSVLNADVKTKNVDLISKIETWNGNHNIENIGSVVYYKWLYHVLNDAMVDEIGERNFEQFMTTHVMRNSISTFVRNDSSAWWDNVKTQEKENYKSVITQAFEKSVAELKQQLGEDFSKWNWGKVHILTHAHALGAVKPLDKIFNVGPFPMPGGNETVNQQGFDLNGSGLYKTKFGAALRRIVDFAHRENALSILPTGESGNFMSDHYKDQAKMYSKDQYRPELTDRKSIEEKCKNVLILHPEK